MAKQIILANLIAKRPTGCTIHFYNGEKFTRKHFTDYHEAVNELVKKGYTVKSEMALGDRVSIWFEKIEKVKKPRPIGARPYFIDQGHGR